MPNRDKTTEEKAEQILRMVQAGEYLKELRSQRNLSMKEACEELSLSTTYLSEIERGVKMPSDLLIRELASFYDINEDILFEKYGKVPLSVIEELNDNPTLKKMIQTIKDNKKISDERRYEIYESLFKVYKSMIEYDDK